MGKYNSLINYKTGLLLLTPNKNTLNFNFYYTDTKKGSGNAILELKIITFKLKLIMIKKNLS